MGCERLGVSARLSDETTSLESFQKVPLKVFCSHQQILVLAKVVVSEFKEPSSQESVSIPPEAESPHGDVSVCMYQGECMRHAGS